MLALSFSLCFIVTFVYCFSPCVYQLFFSLCLSGGGAVLRRGSPAGCSDDGVPGHEAGFPLLAALDTLLLCI